MTLIDARDTSHLPTAAPTLHEHLERRDKGTDPSKRHRLAERIHLGSGLNGLDQILEPSRRRAFLAAAID